MTTPSPINAKVVVGYFLSWAIHARGYHVADIPADKLTHVNYAFAGVSTAGDCISINPQDDLINFPALQLMKQRWPNIKTLISIGGASNSSNFPEAANPSARQSFAQSCVSFMKSSGFDGIDIAWEFPDTTDKPHYTALLKELRSHLDAQGTADGKHYLLTAALPAGPNEYAHFELDQIHQYLDWVNLVAYDFYTSSNSSTELSAPLYASSTDPAPPKKRASYNIDAAVKAYLAAGVPAAKIVVGVPFFGTGWEGVHNANNGLYQSASGPVQGTWAKDGIFDFEDLASNYVGTYLRFWNAEALAPWLYNPGTGIMISYDDAQSLGLKASYVVSNNLAGVMIWQLSADDGKCSLLNALVSVLNPSPEPATNQNTTSVLISSARSISKATLVPLNVAVPTEGRALMKFGYVGQLSLQPGEVDAVRKSLAAFADASLQSKHFATTSPLWDLLTAFEGQPMRSLLPSASEFARLPAATLQTFGKALAGLRKQAVDRVPYSLSTLSAHGAVNTPVGLAAPSPNAAGVDFGKAQHLLNLVAVANKGFDYNINASPIGMINLERLEMAPAGIERGALIATIPLAPGEKTAVVQKEWSVTTKEFTSIVTDSLENFSETGVADNTELAQSTTSQIQHANQFNITGTISGGIKLATDVGLSGSVESRFGTQDSSSQSATDSRKHAVAVTQKASSRTKQEHKVTISTTTVTGTSETTTRELVNPSTTDPIRIDYFSMMRKWRVRLYRYGLRLTYDIVIPEPSGALREAYATLAWLRFQLAPFTFSVKYSDITEQLVDDHGVPTSNGSGVPKYQWLANQQGVQVPPPKKAHITQGVGGPIHGLPDKDGDTGFRFFQIPFTVENDYEVEDVTVEVMLSNVGNHRSFYVLGSGRTEDLEGNDINKIFDLTTFNKFMLGARGTQSFTYFVQFASVGSALFTVRCRWTDEARAQWQADVWSALYNAAQTQYYAKQQDLAAQISQLEDQLNNVDTLTLRREESDEIMKGVLRFLLGPEFDFMPQGVIDVIKASGADMNHGVGFTGNALGLNKDQLTTVRLHEDKIRFINQAIEWENVVSFLYSYFWDVPDSWDFIRQIKHPDASRQMFLRAGAARVVLTVRKGWEEAWVGFAEGGFKDAPIDPNHPYLSIAQEIAAYDDRNYPGIPPANPGQSAVRLEDAVYTTSSANLSPSNHPVEIAVDSSAGFLVGAQVVIDTRVDTSDITTDDFGMQEAQIITVIRDGKHITVQKLDHPHGSRRAAFAIVQPGEKGALIAEWNEYTPTSGTDIAVTSNLTTIA